MEFPRDHSNQSSLDDPRLEDLARYWLELTSYDLGKWLAYQRLNPSRQVSNNFVGNGSQKLETSIVSRNQTGERKR